MSDRICIAYIDGANLHKGIETLGWRLVYGRFRSWMRQKYGISSAKLFIGYMKKHADIYVMRKAQGYECIFKEVVYSRDGRAKGNCDSDLVLSAVRDYFELGMTVAILISSDGDYASLIKFWQEKKVTCFVLSPSPIKQCSWLLRKTNVTIFSLEEVQHKLMKKPKKEKAPGTDVSVQEPLSW